MEHALGAALAPAHPGPIEAHADEVADRALDGAGADVKVVVAQRVVRHALAMLAEVGLDLEHLRALGLVARAGLRDGSVRVRQRRDDLGWTAPATQLAHAVGHPRGELIGAFAMQTPACGPQLLDDVHPVDARLGGGEPARVLLPDRLGAVGEEQRAHAQAARPRSTNDLSIRGPLREQRRFRRPRSRGGYRGDQPAIARHGDAGLTDRAAGRGRREREHAAAEPRVILTIRHSSGNAPPARRTVARAHVPAQTAGSARSRHWYVASSLHANELS